MKLSIGSVFVCIVLASHTLARPVYHGSLYPRAAKQKAPQPKAPQPSAPQPNEKVMAPAKGASVGAAYFMTNEPDGNFIVAADIGSDGQLTLRRAYDTGGLGAHGITDPNGPDPLFSQGAVKASSAGNVVALVNSGSDTLTMFSIDPNDPTSLSMMGRPVGSAGEFPMSVAFNKAGDTLCALNGGSVNGVGCFKVNSQTGLTPIPNTVRSLNLNQTTPATGPAGSASHIVFTEDNSQLVASVKGVPPQPGFLAVWDVAEDGSLSEEFTSIAPGEGGLLPFSMTIIPGKNAILATDAGVGFDIFDLSATSSGNSNADNQNVNNTSGDASDANASGNNATNTDASSGDGTIADRSVADNVKSAKAPGANKSETGSSKAIANASDANNGTDVNASDVNATAADNNGTVADASNANNATDTNASGVNATAADNNGTVADANNASGDLSSVVPIEGQSATCWSSFSPNTGNFFLTDIGTATITEVNVDDNLKGTIVKQYPQANGSATIDNDVATIGNKDFLYVLSPNAASIDVLALPAPGNAQNIQKVDIAGPAKAANLKISANNLQGMTVFIKKA